MLETGVDRYAVFPEPRDRLKMLHQLLSTSLEVLSLKSDVEYEVFKLAFPLLDDARVHALYDLARQVIQQVVRHTDAELDDIIAESSVMEEWMQHYQPGIRGSDANAPAFVTRGRRVEGMLQAKEDLSNYLAKLEEEEGSLQAEINALRDAVGHQVGRFASVPQSTKAVHDQSIRWNTRT
eukprot:jgi/Botrbrau1/4742/Bobra.0137s0014.1